MSTTLAYTRKFIILKKEFSTIVGINPKGHGKLEMKGLRGVVTINIENAEVDNFYNVVFIYNDKCNSVWDLGKIFTDDIGRGKGEYVFIQRDLEAKNFSMDKIVGIIIMRDADILLAGYIDKENGGIERYIESVHTNPRIEHISKTIPEVSEILEEVVDGETIQTKSEQEYNPLYDIPAYEPIIEEQEMEISTDECEIPEYVQYEEIVEVVSEEIIPEEIIPEEVISEEVTIEEILEEEIIPEVDFDEEDFDEDSMEPDYKTLDYMRKLNQKNQTTSYVLSILRFFPYIDPFKYNLKGYNWWIVELDKENEYRSFLPYFSYIFGGNNKEPYANNMTTCNQLMNKYQHYLFGLYNEGGTVKYFVYGVPGNFTTDEHPYKGANGFNTWYQGEKIEGYWIIYIDPMTGKPVDTEVPMVPID